MCTAIFKGALSSVNSALAELDLQPWNTDEMQPKDAGAFLMFSLLRWRITAVSDVVSRRLFLRGLNMALFPVIYSKELHDLTERLVAFVADAPMELMNSILY